MARAPRSAAPEFQRRLLGARALGFRPRPPGPDIGTALLAYAFSESHQGGREGDLADDESLALRFRSKLFHIGVGRAHKTERVGLFVAGRDVRIVDSNGVLIRELTLDPTKDYQPIG
jgi:hypothetical protein